MSKNLHSFIWLNNFYIKDDIKDETMLMCAKLLP